MNILTVTTNYPYMLEPCNGIFVRKTVLALRAKSHRVFVIKPVPAVRYLLNSLRSWTLKPTLSHDAFLKLPIYFGLPLRFTGFRSWALKWNESQQVKAVIRAASTLGKIPPSTIIYAHFLPSARLALSAFPCIPVVAILGESDPWYYDEYYGSSWLETLLSCSAVIAVSENGYNYYLERCPALKDRLHFVPNGVDLNLFQPQDKLECRARLGISSEIKLAVFVGGFEDRKGPLRVLEAARRADFKVAFLGRGEQEPLGPEVLVSKSVDQDELVRWLGAADCFVLPSLSEGRSNAVLEAMACGVPVVVSNLPFNTEFVTSKCGALVDGTCPDSIAYGLKSVINEQHSHSMRLEARKVAECFSYESRIDNVEAILETSIDSASHGLQGDR